MTAMCSISPARITAPSPSYVVKARDLAGGRFMNSSALLVASWIEIQSSGSVSTTAPPLVTNWKHTDTLLVGAVKGHLRERPGTRRDEEDGDEGQKDARAERLPAEVMPPE